jgi:hypothetical protein
VFLPERNHYIPWLSRSLRSAVSGSTSFFVFQLN